MATAVELHIKTLPTLEGTVKHKDLKNIKTLPYGIVNDPDKNPSATTRNKKAAKSLGYDLNDLTIDQAKEVATKISNDIDKELSENSKVGKEYLNLSDDLKTLVIDAMFNTGKVYKDLIKASTTYMSDKNEDTLYDVIKESRRISKGKTVKGLDNRVGKLATMVGIISNPNDVAKYGLDKVDVLPEDVKLAQKFAEPTMSDTDRMLEEEKMPDPILEVDPGDEENPRTQLDLPPQAITPKERDLTGVAPKPLSRSTLEQTDEMLEEGDDPLSDAMGPRLITQQTSGIDLNNEEDMEGTPTGDSIFTEFFSSLGDVSDEDQVFEADELNLKEGGSVEEVDFVKEKSEKNDPPPGATPEEVADDIPAMLSEGEYVLPANVVKYIGLERIMDMHRGVLREIQQMEDLGMIQNVDENGKPEDDDKEMTFLEPEEGVMQETIIIAGKPKDGMMCPPKLNEGAAINRNVDIGDLRENIASERSPEGFTTTYDPSVGIIKIKTPSGNITVDDTIVNYNKDPDQSTEGADPGAKNQGLEKEYETMKDFKEAAIKSIKDIFGMGDDADDETIGGVEAVGGREGTQSDDTGNVGVGGQTPGGGPESESEATGPDPSEGAEAAGAAKGGLMQRKGYANGGSVNYNIAGVGQVGGNLTQGAMNEMAEALPKPKTYDEIKGEVQGFEFPDLNTASTDPNSENYYGRKLQGNLLTQRQEKADLVYRPDQSRENAYNNDSELQVLLRKAGIDSDNFVDVMDQYKAGSNDLLGQGPSVLNEQLKSGLDALTDKRRMIREGVKAEDIPEGATNRDMLKKIFFNEIDDFGAELDRDNYQPNEKITGIINQDPNNFNPNASEEYKAAIKSYDLDGPADPQKLGYAASILDSDRGASAIPVKEDKGSGIMGERRYVEGVGYVKAA
tara:strand:+ start:186 stop:2900 length:2715 start_codon:yes stop_codon:yes gene_type:complete